ncbi:MAG: hypothetical protein ACSHX0_09870 [Akkermansiaceae bacterium]
MIDKTKQPRSFFVVWSLVITLAVAAVWMGVRFFQTEKTEIEQSARSSSRGSHCLATTQSKSTGSSEQPRYKQATAANAGQSDKKTSGRETKQKSTRLSSNEKGKKVNKNGERLDSKLLIGARVLDPNNILRNELMGEAIAISINSEDSWRNLISIAKEYHRAGDKQKAQEVLKKAERTAIAPENSEYTAVAILEVVKTMLLLQDISSAKEALKNIQDPLDYQLALVQSAVGAARYGEIDAARYFIRQITEAKNRDTALLALSTSEARYESSLTAMQTAMSISDQKKKDQALYSLTQERAKLRDYLGSSLAVQQIQDSNTVDRAYVALAQIRAQFGDLEGSMGAIQYLKDQVVVDMSLRNLSNELASQGMFSNSAYVSNHIYGESEKSQALEKLSIEQARKGDLAGSLIRTGTIPSEKIRERALMSLSNITAYKKNSGQARNIARTITSGVYRDRALKGIAQADATRDNHAGAFNTLQEISRHDEKALALISIARVQQKQGELIKASHLLEDAHQELNYVNLKGMKDKILGELAMAYVEGNEVSRSFSMLDSMQVQSQKDKMYQKLATHLAVKDMRSAQEAIRLIQSDKTQLQTGDSVVKAFAKKTEAVEAMAQLKYLEDDRQKIVFLLEVSKLL